MSVFREFNLTDKAGTTFKEYLARNVNVERSPDVRQQIIDGVFQFDSVANHRSLRPFFYMDRPKKLLIYVLPKQDRYNWRSASKTLAEGAALFPKDIFKRKTISRVVFGFDELREKLILQDAGIDDTYMEYLKVLVLHDHPFLLQRSRMNLLVDSVNEDEIRFVATFDHSKDRFSIRLLWESITENNLKSVKKWAKNSHQKDLYNLESDGDLWINFKRWSPALDAQSYLNNFAKAVRRSEEIDLNGREFEIMISYLPRGNHLSSWAKQDLREINKYAKAAGRQDIQDQLFELRFGIELEDDWSKNNDPDDIDTLWDLLKDLPDSNVEGNTSISKIIFDERKGGGSYDPDTKEIAIGESELPYEERFAKIVRHEVGHAVHDKSPAIVNRFLKDQYGWATYSSSNKAIDEWVSLTGGWGSLSQQECQQVRRVIRLALGDEKWAPGRFSIPQNHPWNLDDLGPRLAFEASISPNRYWWDNYQNWHQHEGKAFAFNFYYKTLMSVDVKAIETFEKMPDSYAAMSHHEFFAELYAVFYDLEADISFLPVDVQRWFEEQIGRRGTQLD